MNDLLTIATKVMEEFDPTKDSVYDYENVPDGLYNCLVEEVSKKHNEEKGTDRITVKCSVIGGEYDGKYIFVNHYFTTEKAKIISFKKILQLINFLGYQKPNVEVFDNLDALAEMLNSMAGNQITIKQTTNKAGYPNHEYIPIK